MLSLLYGPILTYVHDKTTALTIQTFVGKMMSLLFNMLSRYVIVFLPRSTSFNFMAAVTVCNDFGAQEKKSVTVSTFFPSRWCQRGPNGELELLLPLSSKEATLLSVVSEEATWETPRTGLAGERGLPPWVLVNSNKESGLLPPHASMEAATPSPCQSGVKRSQLKWKLSIWPKIS